MGFAWVFVWGFAWVFAAGFGYVYAWDLTWFFRLGLCLVFCLGLCLSSFLLRFYKAVKDNHSGRTLRPGDECGLWIFVGNQSDHVVNPGSGALVSKRKELKVCTICKFLALFGGRFKNKNIAEVCVFISFRFLSLTPTQNTDFGVIDRSYCSTQAKDYILRQLYGTPATVKLWENIFLGNIFDCTPSDRFSDWTVFVTGAEHAKKYVNSCLKDARASTIPGLTQPSVAFLPRIAIDIVSGDVFKNFNAFTFGTFGI